MLVVRLFIFIINLLFRARLIFIITRLVRLNLASTLLTGKQQLIRPHNREGTSEYADISQPVSRLLLLVKLNPPCKFEDDPGS
jgi:hypothetical protein